MSTQPLTLHLPDQLHARLQQSAHESNRTLEAELLEVLSTVVPAEESLPRSLAEEVAGLNDQDNANLWQAARSRLSEQQSAQLEEFHLKRQSEGLTGAEARTLAELAPREVRSPKGKLGASVQPFAPSVIKTRTKKTFAVFIGA